MTVIPSATPCRMASSWSCERRTSSSHCRRSVMSRTKPVNDGGPGALIRDTASSTGNSVPSARRPAISTREPMMGPSPVSRYRARPSLCWSRYRCGMIVSAISLPTTSSRDRPNSASADRLNSTMRPVWSIEITPSNAASRMALRFASDSRRLRSTSTRSMNWAICDPITFIVCRSASFGGRTAGLKNSRTPRICPASVTGNPAAACSPPRAADSARGKFVSAVTSGIQ